MKPYIVTLTDSDLYNEDNDCGRGQQLDGVEFGGEIQFTNNRRVVCVPNKPTQPIANQGGEKIETVAVRKVLYITCVYSIYIER